jgi:hypothetical protein
MTEQEILEGNKLIAKFMGAKLNRHVNDRIYSENQFTWTKEAIGWIDDINMEGVTTNWINGLKYHESWDWIMPVVEKIEKNLDIKIIIGGSDWCTIIRITSMLPYTEYEIVDECSLTGKKIEAVWLAVIKYIKWHNT